MKVKLNDQVRPGRAPVIGQLTPKPAVHGGAASLKLSDGSEPPNPITTDRSNSPPSFTIVTVIRVCWPNTTCVGDATMLTLKLGWLSLAAAEGVGGVRRRTGGVVRGSGDGLSVAVGEEDAGAAEKAGSLALTAGRLVAGLANGLSDDVADDVARAASLRPAVSRHGCTASATTATTATTLTALATMRTDWPRCTRPSANSSFGTATLLWSSR